MSRWLASRLTAAVLLAAALLLPGAPALAQTAAVDLELVLAIDSSDSVDRHEFALQVNGLAAALRHPAVHDAIAAGRLGAIALMIVEWASETQQRVHTPWVRIDGPASAARVAERLAGMTRSFERGVTSVSGIIDFAVRSIRNNRYRGDRAVLDISSDGRHNDGRPVALARAAARDAGVTVNALTIVNEYRGLDRYFAEEVITGAGAFVEVASDYEDYREAILRKLVRELRNIPVAAAPGDGGGRIPASARRIGSSTEPAPG